MNSALPPSLLKHVRKINEDTAININNAEFDNFLKHLSQSADDTAIDRVISLYQKTIIKHEQEFWQKISPHEDIKQYQNSFKVLEKLYELKTVDDRYNFKIVIPVADRPQHLKQCLYSLLTLCKSYQYGGLKNGKFTNVSVLIADDSKDKNNIRLHENYCTEFTNSGITTEYFGLEEQLTLAKLFSENNDGLSGIISDTDSVKDIDSFSHKGAAIMRNITYLKLKSSISQSDLDKNTLFYFIDSDQEFCVNTPYSDKKHYAINYFHYLNEVFKTQDITILTGKVVGDPPVSPAVMANNFQQDILNFIHSISNLNPGDPCQFHQHEKNNNDNAAYHDMANLFGFSNQNQVFDYHCTLKNTHDNSECFNAFSSRLERFFYGEHPTRKTFFNYENEFTITSPARTVYTGNYVIKPETLRYFIPFATLKLRMAGPVLGRILKSELQDSFVSANLPMLHNRTIESTGQSEFRAGVNNNNTQIDLGNEFVRQFYGDVMLFTMEKITNKEFSVNPIDRKAVQTIINDTYNTIKENYIDKHNAILQFKTQINDSLIHQSNWWNKPSETPSFNTALSNFNNFLNNIQSNFDSNAKAYQKITSTDFSQKYLDEILQAILHYQDDLANWKKALRFK